MSNPIEVTATKVMFQEAMRWTNTEEGKGFSIGEAIILYIVLMDSTKTDADYEEAMEIVKERGTVVTVT